MNYLSGNVASWLCKEGVIAEEDKELYEYSVYCFLLTSVPLIMALIFSAIIGGIKQYITLLIPFMCLRQYCGGYHAKKAWICMVFSFAILVLMTWIVLMDTGGMLHWFFVLAACMCIVKNSPIESENRKLDEQEKTEYHKKAVQIVIMFLTVEILLTLLMLNNYANAVGVGIILVAISQVHFA